MVRLQKTSPKIFLTSYIFLNLSCLNFIIEKFKRYDDALSSLKTSLLIRRKVLGLGHVDVANTFRALGNVHKAKQDYTHSSFCFKECLRIISNNTGKTEDINIAHTLKDLSETLLSLEQYDEALYSLSEATRIYKIQHYNKSYLAKCYGLLGHVYSKSGDVPKAIHHYELSISLSKNVDVFEDDALFFPSILYACATMHDISGNEAAAAKKYTSKCVVLRWLDSTPFLCHV